MIATLTNHPATGPASCPAGMGATAPSPAAEMAFRLLARRNRLLGQWAAARMQLSPAESEAYAKGVVQAEFEETGEEEVVRRILGDLILGGVEAGEAEVRLALKACEAEARKSLENEA